MSSENTAGQAFITQVGTESTGEDFAVIAEMIMSTSTGVTVDNDVSKVPE